MRFLLVVAAGLLAAGVARPALADYQVRSPDEIDLGEIEIEHNGSLVPDGGAASYTAELGTGLTPWWHGELELGADRNSGAGAATVVREVVAENTFELTEPGEYYVDTGFYFEYAQTLARGVNASSNGALFGPLFQTDIGRTTETVNLLLARQFGPDETSHGLDFSYAAQSRWNVWAPLSPAVEVYGDAGTLGDVPKWQSQRLLVGPVLVGVLRLGQIGLGEGGKLKYELGYLFGATSASDRGTVRWRVEVEVPF